MYVDALKRSFYCPQKFNSAREQKVRETQDAMVTRLMQLVADDISLISAPLFDPISYHC